MSEATVGISEELMLLMRQADAAIHTADYATAETRLLQIELRLALTPNASRADTSMEFSQKVQDLLDRVRRLKSAKTGIQTVKIEHCRATPLEDVS